MNKKIIGIASSILILVLVCGGFFFKSQQSITQTNHQKNEESTHQEMQQESKDVVNEQVNLFTKEEIEQATSDSLTIDTVGKLYTHLEKSEVWVSLGYSQEEAKDVAARFTASESQAKGILKNIALNDQLGLKIVSISKPSYSTINLGSEPLSKTVGATTKHESKSEEDSYGKATLTTIEKLEMKIKYDDKKIEMNYKVNADQVIKANYRNDFTNEKIESEEAKRKIEALFGDVSMESSNESELKQSILDKLNVSDKFKQFELEVAFKDQSQVKFTINN